MATKGPADDEEAPACAICAEAALSFQPLDLSNPLSFINYDDLDGLDGYRCLVVGKATQFHQHMRCSTCQTVSRLVDEDLARGYGCPRAKPSFLRSADDAEQTAFCDRCVVEIRFGHNSGAEKHFLAITCYSTNVDDTKVHAIGLGGLDELRPHTSVVLSHLSAAHPTFKNQDRQENLVDHKWPTWYPAFLGGQRDFGIEFPQGPIDFSRIARWIDYCDEAHTCQSRFSPGKTAPGQPKILIDTKNMCITDQIPVLPVYVALSYVWGTLPSTLSTCMANYDSLRIQDALKTGEYALKIPRTISDAISLCQNIGIRYLWVDRLCIVQDDKNIIHDQVKIMDQIYKYSYFTLICADGDNANFGLPGIGDALRSYKPEVHLRFSSELQFSEPVYIESGTSPWHQRAWTLQERALSSRTLVFHNNTFYWQCATATWNEIDSADGGKTDRSASSRLSDRTGRLPRFPSFALSQVSSLPVFDQKPIPLFIDYCQLVGGYSGRLLSFPSDAERAFSAILNELSRSFHGGFFYGLPTLLFDVSLLWLFQEDGNPRRRVGFPSWSWLGWEAPVFLVSMLGEFPIYAPDMWNPWDLFDHEHGGIPISSHASWRSFEPLTIWWRVARDSRRVKISNSHSSWLRFGEDNCAEGWHRHSMTYYQSKELYEYWYTPTNDLNTMPTVDPSSSSRWKILPDDVDEADMADAEGWRKHTTQYYTHDNWPRLFFRHPFPVVEQVESIVESRDEWLPYLEFQAQSYTMKPFRVISDGDMGRDKKLHLEHETFPGILLGELHPNDSSSIETLLGTECEIVIFARSIHSVLVYDHPEIAEYAVAGLWIEWVDGIAYRKGLAFLYGPRRNKRTRADRVKLAKNVDLFKDCPHVVKDIKLG